MDFLNKLAEKTAKVAKKIEEQIKVPSEVREERLNTCLDCEELFRPTNTCKMCGCFMDIKTWMPSQKCPMDKWGEHIIATDAKS